MAIDLSRYVRIVVVPKSYEFSLGKNQTATVILKNIITIQIANP